MKEGCNMKNDEMENDEIENGDTKIILQGLAQEISDMTEEEKLLSLKKIVQSELKGNRNRFWTTITKKMLISEELTNKILSNEVAMF
jgi:hypothetical protein